MIITRKPGLKNYAQGLALAMQNIFRQIDSWMGVAIMLQDEEGGLVSVRFNRQTKTLEYYDGELWR